MLSQVSSTGSLVGRERRGKALSADGKTRQGNPEERSRQETSESAVQRTVAVGAHHTGLRPNRLLLTVLTHVAVKGMGIYWWRQFHSTCCGGAIELLIVIIVADVRVLIR